MNEDGNASVMRGLADAEKRAADLGKRIADEAEAWKVSQLAVALYSASGLPVGIADNAAGHVQWARIILAEARPQTATPTPEPTDD